MSSRRRPAAAPATSTPAAAAPSKGRAPATPPPKGALYYAHQYGGLVLGVAACAGSAACYEQEDPLMVWKLVAWLGLATIGLALHETRPYRRMNYGDAPLPSASKAE